jgi:hypothetical protein
MPKRSWRQFTFFFCLRQASQPLLDLEVGIFGRVDNLQGRRLLEAMGPMVCLNSYDHLDGPEIQCCNST